MLNNDQIGIVIPIYKSDLSDREKISITQALKVLIKYRIIFVAPQSLNIMLSVLFISFIFTSLFGIATLFLFGESSTSI